MPGHGLGDNGCWLVNISPLHVGCSVVYWITKPIGVHVFIMISMVSLS